MAAIVLEDVEKRYDDGTLALHELSLDIADGEFVVLVGPSGSGKSTALRIVAGLEQATGGTVRIGDRVVNDLPPRDRDIAMVFQNYALYPHMSVRENMAFGLKLRKVAREEIDRRVEQAADLLGITELLHRRPRQLSGGQRQRVAMGRAIVREPSAFLMDEPLSNLDAKLRVQMRSEISRLHQRLGTTTLYVTHDQTEAMTMGDRVAVMRQGTLLQVDAPQTLYDRPVNLFVAGFIGSPAMNMVTARLDADGDGMTARFGSRHLAVPAEIVATRSLGRYAGSDVVLGIRPEDLEDAEFVPGAEADQLIEVTVTLAEPMGAEIVAYFDVDAPPVRTAETIELAGETEDDDAAPPASSNFTARLNARSSVRVGETAKLAVDVDRLYFFDPADGRAIW